MLTKLLLWYVDRTIIWCVVKLCHFHASLFWVFPCQSTLFLSVRSESSVPPSQLSVSLTDAWLSPLTGWSSHPCPTTLPPCSPVMWGRPSRTRWRWKEWTLMHCGPWCSMHTQVYRLTDRLFLWKISGKQHIPLRLRILFWNLFRKLNN